ncbi:hypothetical protein L9F63_012611 [Diploptera punctata]|uniref:Uncharacterized protein n=1 Tax=Diploptera punctata TaxID=6984 RepID=A0AAD8EN72_DIPPU|nr:hypothetical protein L9F63_012611 [Diploptera punctata]
MDLDIYNQQQGPDKGTMLRRPWPPLYRHPLQHRPRFCFRPPDPPAEWRDYNFTNKGRDYYFMAPMYRNALPPPPPPLNYPSRHMLLLDPRQRRTSQAHVPCPCMQRNRSRSLEDVRSEANSDWEEDNGRDGPWSSTRPLQVAGSCGNKENHRMQRRSMENLLDTNSPWRKPSSQVRYLDV